MGADASTKVSPVPGLITLFGLGRKVLNQSPLPLGKLALPLPLKGNERRTELALKASLPSRFPRVMGEISEGEF